MTNPITTQPFQGSLLQSDGPPQKRARREDLSTHDNEPLQENKWPSLKERAAAVVISSFWMGNLGIDEVWPCNKIIIKMWNDLKESSQGDKFGLQYVMCDLENSLIKAEEEQYKQSPLTKDEKEDLLQSYVCTLFKNLAERFKAKEGGPIPVDIASYVRLAPGFEDRKIQTEYLGQTHLKLKTVEMPYHAFLPLSQLRISFANPADAAWWRAIRTLEFSGGAIHSIPDEVAELVNLTTLRLNNNRIYSVPASLGKLTKLITLDLSNNKISTISDSIGKLVNLQHLNLGNNNISTIPDSLFDNLPQLCHLVLASNQIHDIPDTVIKCTARNMMYVDINHNQISTVSCVFLSCYLQNQNCFSIETNSFSVMIYRNEIMKHAEELWIKYHELINYKCLSSFSTLYRHMILENRNRDLTPIAELFAELEFKDQHLIIDIVRNTSGFNSAPTPGEYPLLKYKEYPVFNDMNIFYKAVRYAIFLKHYLRSLPHPRGAEQLLFYREFLKLKNPKIENPSDDEVFKWAENSKFSNVLLLIDAMDKIPFPSVPQKGQ